MGENQRAQSVRREICVSEINVSILLTLALAWSGLLDTGAKANVITVHDSVFMDLPSGFGVQAPSLSSSGSGASFNLIPGPGISGNADALTAFDRAAGRWAGVLHDPVTIDLNINMAALGPNILGATLVTQFRGRYGTIRNAVAAGAVGEADEPDEGAFLGQLPTGLEFSATTPPGLPVWGMSASRANLKALGFTGLPGTTDGRITFSSQFPWDYDSSDGIAVGTWDFEAVAAHEIGHALGFISEVDRAELLQLLSVSRPLFPTPLDLFRFDSIPTDFTGDPRKLTAGDPAVFWDGTDALALSTGMFLGDGYQASHFKDDLGLGLMDPTLGAGELGVITANDLSVLDLIGWDVSAPEPNTWLLVLLSGGLVAVRRRRK